MSCAMSATIEPADRKCQELRKGSSICRDCREVVSLSVVVKANTALVIAEQSREDGKTAVEGIGWLLDKIVSNAILRTKGGNNAVSEM